MIAKTHDSESLRSREYTYDQENRLIKVELADEASITVDFAAGWNTFDLFF